MIKNSPLNDRNFLYKLDRQRHKELYVRITLLTFDEHPIEYIEGKVTGGSINFDGASSLRRTCNISMVSNNLDVNLYYLGLERKFILEIGLTNQVDNNYNDIIWFPMGLYVTSSFQTSRSTNNYSISIQGKDKTCLLNGDLSGNLPSSVNFGVLEEVSADGKTITYTKVKIKDIIFNLIETYGNEMPHNIIINDIEDSGLELLEYRGKDPVYLYYQPDKNNASHDFICENFTLDGTNIVYNKDGEPVTIDSLKDTEYYPIETILDKNLNEKYQFFDSKDKNNIIYIVKLQYGDCIGYREVDLVYAGDLIANANDSITSVLDKIKNMLGDYEYFYNTKGQFVFQKKKIQYDLPSFGFDEDTKYFDNSKIESNIFYNFEDNELIASINNTPNLTNAKNDYSIWGVRKGSSGGEIPIHLRYAIEQKPTYYKTYLPDNSQEEQWIFKIGEDGSFAKDEENKIITCDWREIIFQMASDYYKYKDLNDNFFYQIAQNNKIENYEEELESLYPTGKTGYESYYSDILGFWRDIFSIDKSFYKQVILTENLYERGKYYTLEPYNSNYVNRFPVYNICNDFEYDDNKIYYKLDVKSDTYFHPNVINSPNLLNFWFDFLDTTGELGKYSTKTIGQRSKCVNDNKITSIYYRPVPNLIFVNSELGRSIENRRTSYLYVNSSEELENCFVTATQNKNAWEEAQGLLNSFAKCTEQLSFNAIPIYYMLPNVRIALKDEFSKMNGEYIIDKISFNLSYNGMMSVTATKIFDDIY